MERAVAATRKPHAHRIIRVTNAPEIEFRNQQRRDEQRGEIMASCGSAPGLKSGNGGIKIQMVRVICQRAFRKNAEIRLQSDQEVSGNFGMQGRVAPCCDAPRPPKAEVTRSKSCRARQRINGLAGPATKFEKKASSDRFMHVPPGRRSNSLLS
jgi:hypothetical protein